MEAIGKFVLSISTAAIIVSIMQSFFKNRATAQLIRLISGLFLLFTLLSPIVKLDLQNLFDTHWNFTTQGEDAVAYGEDLAHQKLQGIIKQQCEAYILDKAEAYHTQLEVEVTLSQDHTPIPKSVRLQGSVSPYVKQRLQQEIQQNLGVSKEQQLWIG